MIHRKYPTAELAFAEWVLREAYRKCFAGNCEKVTQKGSFDLVSAADVAVERFVAEQIHARFPADRFLGEETAPGAALGGRCWVLDPIDGTVNMANGIPVYGMQCALFEDDRCTVSALYFPVWNEMFTAGDSLGAFRDGERLTVARRPLSGAIVSFGDFRHDDPARREQQFAIMARVSPLVSKIRMFGAASMDFASLAAGRTDGAVLFTRNLWDIAPGILLCREAGAEVLSVDGGAYRQGSAGVAVTGSPELAQLLTRQDFSQQ